MADLSIDLANTWFSYDAATGSLIHKERSRDGFSRQCDYNRHLRIVGRQAGALNASGYIWVWISGHRYAAHRVIWLMVTGNLPSYPEFVIDHINGNTVDNRIENLRCVKARENDINKAVSINSKSGVHGVCWKTRERRWMVKINVHGKAYYGGSFVQKDDAIEARKKLESRFGEVRPDRPPSFRAVARQMKKAS